MRRAAQFLIRLYPPSWRLRYGEEFEALLEDSPVGFSNIFDLVKGAIKMRLSVPAFPKLALVLSVSGLLAGLLISFTVTPTYISQGVMQFSGGEASRAAIELEQQVLSRTSLSGIINDPNLNLYRGVRDHIPFEDVIANMRDKDIKIRAFPGNAVQISFAYPDRDKAQQTVNTLLARFVEANFKRGIERAVTVKVNEIASLPVRPARPNRFVFMFIGFGVGFLLAIVIGVFRRRLQPAIPFPAASA
jgi:capsular polysaccharide biosynthesis protein